MSCRILGEKIANDANGVGAVVPPFLHFFPDGLGEDLSTVRGQEK